MKLVYRILLHMSWALSLLLAAWAVLFYFTMIDEIDQRSRRFCSKTMPRCL